MAAQRITQIDWLGVTVGADADVRVTGDMLLAATEGDGAQVRVTQQDLLAQTINADSNLRVTEIVFLGVLSRETPPPPGPPFRELFSPLTGF